MAEEQDLLAGIGPDPNQVDALAGVGQSASATATVEQPKTLWDVVAGDQPETDNNRPGALGRTSKTFVNSVREFVAEAGKGDEDLPYEAMAQSLIDKGVKEKNDWYISEFAHPDFETRRENFTYLRDVLKGQKSFIEKHGDVDAAIEELKKQGRYPYKPKETPKVFDLPQAQGWAEHAEDFVGGASAFLAELALTRKVAGLGGAGQTNAPSNLTPEKIGKLSEWFYWEAMSEWGGNKPGAGAGAYGTYGLAGEIIPNIPGKSLGQFGAAWVAGKIQGLSNQDATIQAAAMVAPEALGKLNALRKSQGLKSIESLKGEKAKGKGESGQGAKVEPKPPTPDDVINDIAKRMDEFEQTYGRQMDADDMRRATAQDAQDRADTRSLIEQLYEKVAQGDTQAVDDIRNGNYKGGDAPFAGEGEAVTTGLPQVEGTTAFDQQVNEIRAKEDEAKRQTALAVRPPQQGVIVSRVAQFGARPVKGLLPDQTEQEFTDKLSKTLDEYEETTGKKIDADEKRELIRQAIEHRRAMMPVEPSVTAEDARFIQSPAIKTKDGEIVTSDTAKNHAEIIEENPAAKKGVKGFVTDDGKFVNRIKGAKIAKAAGQVDEGVNILHSEDLKSPPPAEKQAWEMTPQEYSKSVAPDAYKQLHYGAGLEGDPAQNDAWVAEAWTHPKFVQQALSEGKPVPRSVLEEYKGEKWADEALAKTKPPTKAGYGKKPELSPEQRRMKGSVLVPTREEIGKAVNFLGDIAKGLKTGILRFGLEPSKIIEKEFGADVWTSIYKGTAGNVRYREAQALEQKLDAIDNTVFNFRNWTQHFTKEQNEAFTLTNGEAATEGGKNIQAEMEAILPKELQDPAVRQAYKAITDYNHKYGQEVAQKYEGEDLNYVDGYVRGQYKGDPRSIARFVKKWVSTDAWQKEKTFPTAADAKAAGFDLKYPNAIDNAISETRAIANLEGKHWMLDEAMTNGGLGVYIESSESATSHPDWIDGSAVDPVFDGYNLHPDYAMGVANLTSFNKVMNSPTFRPMRDAANFIRGVRLFVPIFHHLNIVKSQIKDLAMAGIQTGGKSWEVTMKRAAAQMGKDLGMTTDNPDFAEYLKTGGGHGMSMEVESKELFDRAINALDKRIGGPVLNTLTARKYANWLFENYIPAVKWESYQLHTAKLESKLGRELTSTERMNVIKEGQNFYGEMNESLFGRSGTMTSALRLIFTAPGYGEGNFRTIYDATFHWGDERGTRSRYFIPMSFVLAGLTAQVGSRLMTGQWPDMPQKTDDLRDLFKTKTNWKDDKGRQVMIDNMTYERDYWSIYGNLITGHPDQIPVDIAKRAAGMTSSLFQAAADLADIARGRSLYDWKGNKVVPVYDTFCEKAMDLAKYELGQQGPIALSIYQQSRIKDVSKSVAAVETLLGLRETFSEADKRTNENISKLFALHDDRLKQFYALSKDPNPTQTLQKYNEKVEEVLKIMPKELQDEWRKKLIIDIPKYKTNLGKQENSPKRTPQQKERAEKILLNFGAEK